MIRITDEEGILPPLDLSMNNGWRVSSFEAGFPTVDEDIIERVQANGMLDYTRYYSESIVTMEAMALAVPGGVSRQSMIDRLAQFCHPARRVRIHWQHVDDTEVRSIRCRGRSLTRPNTNTTRRSVQAQWVAAQGVQESSTVKQVTLVPSSAVSSPGRSYPLVYDRTYPVAGPSGATQAFNEGNEIAWPVIRISGNVVDPVITNFATGDKFDLSVQVFEGNYLEIRTGEDLILMNGNIADSRYSSLKIATSKWWGLFPGDNALSFSAASTSGFPTAQVIWRDAYI